MPSDRAVVLRRVTRRLIPFAFICYVVAYIDRVNIGFAARELQHDLGLSATEYGVGAGLFFLGYCLFEIPSNLVLDRVGARRWIARIMIVWGLVSMATMLITDVWSFMIARVVLGIAEAGFFPGMVLYLTYWIPAAERARANALFMTAAPVSVIVGAPVSEALLSMHGVWGLHGWQWLFLLEGLPAVILGILALRVLTDRPEQADWLPPAEREWLASTMNAERALRGEMGHVSVGRSLRSGRVWLLSIVYLMNATVTYGIFLWLPRMLQDVAAHGAAVRRRADRDGADRQTQRQDRRAEDARGGVRGDGRDRPVHGGGVPEQPVPAGPGVHGLPDRAAIGDERVLDDSADAARRHRGGRRHRDDQRDWQPGRVLRADDHGNAAGHDRRLQRRPARPGGGADRRGDPGQHPATAGRAVEGAAGDSPTGARSNNRA